MSEIEKCAWCGKEPTHVIGYGYTGLSKCLCIYMLCDAHEWNDFHTRIMAQRRKDFDAGYQLAAEHEGNQTGCNFDSFDDYIKGEE